MLCQNNVHDASILNNMMTVTGSFHYRENNILRLGNLLFIVA